MSANAMDTSASPPSPPCARPSRPPPVVRSRSYTDATLHFMSLHAPRLQRAYKLLLLLVVSQAFIIYRVYDRAIVVRKFSVNVINVNYGESASFPEGLNGSALGEDGDKRQLFNVKTMGERARERWSKLETARQVKEEEAHRRISDNPDTKRNISARDNITIGLNNNSRSSWPTETVAKGYTTLSLSLDFFWNVTVAQASVIPVNVYRAVVTHVPSSKFITVAIGLAITSRGLNMTADSSMDANLPFFHSLLSTFCKTASLGFLYVFFLAYDETDPLLIKENFRNRFISHFNSKTGPTSPCPPRSRYLLKWVRCAHSHSPAWAQNDAMLEAYLHDMDYYYRVNDDTLMSTPGWTELFIYQLSTYHPPNIGVVGPNHEGGVQMILTYDFVHRTHFEVFGFYYPRNFPTWYADRWITEVYQPARSTKLLQVTLSHTLEIGTRYEAHHERDKMMMLLSRVEKDKNTLIEYVEAVERPWIPRAKRNKQIIAMSLDGAFPGSVWGCIRNAQVVHVHFPGWRLRVYVISDTSSKRAIPDQVRHKLLELDAEVVSVPSDVFDNTTALEVLKYAIVKESGHEDFVIFRDAYQRLTRRDAFAVSDWLKRGSTFHCIRDHPDHGMSAINDGLWGANVTHLRKTFPSVAWQMLRDIKSISSTAAQRRVAGILSNTVWRNEMNSFVCHDSVTCDSWSNSLPFSRERDFATFVGEHFNMHEQSWSKLPLKELRESANQKCQSAPAQVTYQQKLLTSS